MAIAEGNKRVSATLDPIRQGRLDFLLSLDSKNRKRITKFFCECIDREYSKSIQGKASSNSKLER